MPIDNFEGNEFIIIFRNNLRDNFDVVLCKGQSGIEPFLGYQFPDTVAMLTDLNDADAVKKICDHCRYITAITGEPLPMVVIPNNFPAVDSEVIETIKTLYNSTLAEFNDPRAVMGSEDPFELLALPHQKDIARSAWDGTGRSNDHEPYFQRLAFALAQTADPRSQLFLAANQAWGGMSGKETFRANS